MRFFLSSGIILAFWSYYLYLEAQNGSWLFIREKMFFLSGGSLDSKIIKEMT
jgi:hypothetical protein